ncbi:hypothetical protein TIFTF001_026388 [Ficus carica]|uniref:Uncharacterized protein n=1 Tax=Ficus carica TaxID=3494 RepID=A0AA88IXZ7_FICCA|nr:hypothetical protein TIFTF001_026388 [Ficus carica]
MESKACGGGALLDGIGDMGIEDDDDDDDNDDDDGMG